MTTGAANRWVVASAVTVAGIYGYQFISGNATHNPAQFVTAWGFTFFLLSLIANGAPGLAAAFATLILAADLLVNLDQKTGIIKSILTAESSATGVSGARPKTAKGRGKAAPSSHNGHGPGFAGAPQFGTP